LIFIDSDIPMYLIGAPHPNKLGAISLLEQVIRGEDSMITSVEVYQALLHRYAAID